VLTDAHTHHPSPHAHIRVLSLPQLLSTASPSPWVAAGVHPWEVGAAGDQERAALERWVRDPACVAIGETGLDRLRGGDWEIQLAWFRWQWELAEAHDKPLVLHCVRAAADVLAMIKHHPPRTAWLWHAYAGGEEQTRQILALHPDSYFSLGPREFGRKGLRVWERLPRDRRLLETDDSITPLEDVYRQAGVEVADYASLAQSFTRLFRVGGPS